MPPPDTPAEPAGPLTVDRRRAVFAALVAAQDGGASVADSRAADGQRYAVTESQVRLIEREGIDKGWPPF
jgi:hypothetical protein